MDRLRTNLCGIQLENPVIAASGTYGYGVEFATVADLNAMGGLVVKGLSREPIALRLVYEASKAVQIPVIGLGGIRSGEDAAEFLVAGAAAVQVGTANFWDPEAPCRIARELDHYLATEKVDNVQQLVGTLQI